MFASIVRRTPTLIRSRATKALAVEREVGMATAEYAVATVAACGFGGVLYKLLSSESVLQLLVELIKKAFGFVL